MAPGSCVHAISWTIDSSVDPENFHPDDLQQCVSPPHHSNHSFPVSSLGNSIPCWGPLSAQYLRDPASAVRPKLEKYHVWMSLHWPTSIIFYIQDWSSRTSYPRKVVDPADIVCWRKRFSPQTLGLLQVHRTHRTSAETNDLLAVVLSFWHLWRTGWTVLMWKDSLCHYHAGYVDIECLQGSHSVPNLSFPCLYNSILLFQLSRSSSETLVDTFWWTITS